MIEKCSGNHRALGEQESMIRHRLGQPGYRDEMASAWTRRYTGFEPEPGG